MCGPEMEPHNHRRPAWIHNRRLALRLLVPLFRLGLGASHGGGRQTGPTRPCDARVGRHPGRRLLAPDAAAARAASRAVPTEEGQDLRG